MLSLYELTNVHGGDQTLPVELELTQPALVKAVHVDRVHVDHVHVHHVLVESALLCQYDEDLSQSCDLGRGQGRKTGLGPRRTGTEERTPRERGGRERGPRERGPRERPSRERVELTPAQQEAFDRRRERLLARKEKAQAKYEQYIEAAKAKYGSKSESGEKKKSRRTPGGISAKRISGLREATGQTRKSSGNGRKGMGGRKGGSRGR